MLVNKHHDSQSPCEPWMVGHRHKCIVTLQYNPGELVNVTQQKRRRCNESGHRTEQTPAILLLMRANQVDTTLGIRLSVSFL